MILFQYLVYLIYALVAFLIIYFVLNIFIQDRKYGTMLICPNCGTDFKRPIITIRDGSLGKTLYPYGLVQCPKCKELYHVRECRKK